MTAPTPPPPDPRAEREALAYLAALSELGRIARRRARWRLMLGLVIVATAGLISLATYATAGQEAAAEAARTGEGSGSYVVWWGPMAFGGWLTLTAAARLWRLRPDHGGRHARTGPAPVEPLPSAFEPEPGRPEPRPARELLDDDTGGDRHAT